VNTYDKRYASFKARKGVEIFHSVSLPILCSADKLLDRSGNIMIDKHDILETLNDWNSRNRGFPDTFKREQYESEAIRETEHPGLFQDGGLTNE